MKQQTTPLVIECLYYPGCSSQAVLPERLARALAEEGLEAEVRHRVVSVEEGQALGIAGSPTVRINETDILEAPGAGGA